MLTDAQRLIVILGMAHSGTTIVAHTLAQHPDVLACADGHEAWIYESTWLQSEQSGPISVLLARNPDQRILLKRPWVTVGHGDWLSSELRDARFLYCLRPLEEICVSWSRPTAFVDDTLKHGSREYQERFYQRYLESAERMASKVPHWRIVNHLDLVTNPSQTFEDLRAWLNLREFEFDVTRVGRFENVKTVLSCQRITSPR